MTIKLRTNSHWTASKESYLKSKYAPVVVDKDANIRELTEIKNIRKDECRGMFEGGNDWPDVRREWRFSDDDHDSMTHLSPTTTPLFVTTSGSAAKIKDYLDSTKQRLAWDPRYNQRSLTYIFVHKTEFDEYMKHLGKLFGKGFRFQLVGWSGGALTGFGATRAAVLQLAAELKFKPDRILMMDQDVLGKDSSKPDDPAIAKELKAKHDAINPATGKPQQVIGLGKGAPDRANKLTDDKGFRDSASPTQQYVSISAPFRPDRNKLYAYFMVAGGEDMAMSYKAQHFGGSKGHNVALRPTKIDKADLGTKADNSPATSAVKTGTVNRLFAREKNRKVELDGVSMTIETAATTLIKKLPTTWGITVSVATVSSLIIERIILARYRYDKGARHADKEQAETDKFIADLMATFGAIE